MRHQARQPNICSSMTKCSNPLSANRLFMFSPTIYVVVTATTACANSKYSRYQFVTEKKTQHYQVQRTADKKTAKSFRHLVELCKEITVQKSTGLNFISVLFKEYRYPFQ